MIEHLLDEFVQYWNLWCRVQLVPGHFPCEKFIDSRIESDRQPGIAYQFAELGGWHGSVFFNPEAGKYRAQHVKILLQSDNLTLQILPVIAPRHVQVVIHAALRLESGSQHFAHSIGKAVAILVDDRGTEPFQERRV